MKTAPEGHRFRCREARVISVTESDKFKKTYIPDLAVVPDRIWTFWDRYRDSAETVWVEDEQSELWLSIVLNAVKIQITENSDGSFSGDIKNLNYN